MLSINVSHAKPFLSYPYEEVLCPRLERAQRELLNGGGKGSDGGQGCDGCIIIYYRKKKELQSGPLVTSNNYGLLDSLGRRMIV